MKLQYIFSAFFDDNQLGIVAQERAVLIVLSLIVCNRNNCTATAPKAIDIICGISSHLSNDIWMGPAPHNEMKRCRFRILSVNPAYRWRSWQCPPHECAADELNFNRKSLKSFDWWNRPISFGSKARSNRPFLSTCFRSQLARWSSRENEWYLSQRRSNLCAEIAKDR